MLDRLEGIERLRPHAPGRRIGGDELRVRHLQGLQFAEQFVEPSVGDLGLIADVVEIRVVPQRPAQFSGPPLGPAGTRFAHGAEASRAASAETESRQLASEGDSELDSGDQVTVLGGREHDVRPDVNAADLDRDAAADDGADFPVPLHDVVV